MIKSLHFHGNMNNKENITTDIHVSSQTIMIVNIKIAFWLAQREILIMKMFLFYVVICAYAFRNLICAHMIVNKLPFNLISHMMDLHNS